MKNPHFDFDKLPNDIVHHIEHLERVRRDFIANVSHELRTPLTVIRGYLELLTDQKDVNPKWDPILAQMHQHSLRMEHIIEDLLLLSNLESKEQKIVYQKNLPIAEILNAIFNDAKQLSQGRHQITLSADPNLSIEGVEEELKSLFYNLIVNAIKYTPKGGNIRIVWALSDDKPCLSIIDDGIGIDKKHIPRLTERFYRVDKARSRNSGGTGLGLAIVKHVLLRHDADMTIDSEPGKGSTFCCYFQFDLTNPILSKNI